MNAHRLAWWKPLQGFTGGPLYDLLARHNGTFTGLSGGNTGWAASSRGLVPYSDGAFYVSLPSPAIAGPPISFTLWHYPISTGGLGGIYAENNLHGTLFNASGTLTYSWEGTGDEYSAASGLSLTNNTWQFLGLSITTTAATLYLGLNGKLSSWTNTKTHNAYTTTGANLGTDRAIVNHFCAGYFDDISLYNSALTQAQMLAAYQEGASNYPTEFNRIGPSVFPMGASATTSVGSASGIATASAVGSALFPSVGSASGSASVAGIGSSLVLSVGSASGVANANGTAASIASSVGSAAGAASSFGVSYTFNTATGVGTAAGSAAANAVGQWIAASVGTSAGSATATGVGRAIVASAGSASAVSTSTAVGVGGSARTIVYHLYATSVTPESGNVDIISVTVTPL